MVHPQCEKKNDNLIKWFDFGTLEIYIFCRCGLNVLFKATLYWKMCLLMIFFFCFCQYHSNSNETYSTSIWTSTRLSILFQKFVSFSGIMYALDTGTHFPTTTGKLARYKKAFANNLDISFQINWQFCSQFEFFSSDHRFHWYIIHTQHTHTSKNFWGYIEIPIP